jgi:hypothetical protein
MRTTACGLAVALLLACAPALHAQDSFGNGDGHSGPFMAPAGASSVNVYGQLAADAPPNSTGLTLVDGTGFSNGDLVMLWRPTGLTGLQAGNTLPIDLSASDVGRYEFARVLSVNGNALMLAAPIQNGFSATWTQVVRVPEFTTVNVPAGSTLTAPGWNGATGGIVAFFATGAVVVDGAISVDGAGFRAAPAFIDTNVPRNPFFVCGSTNLPGLDGEGVGNGLADHLIGTQALGNAGGGGSCYAVGGGGGGNGGVGGQGGSGAGFVGTAGPPGGGGNSIVAAPLSERLTFGGGGGGTDEGGAGGAGGGVLLVRADRVDGAGLITANGGSGGFGGGGGAGGSIYVAVDGPTSVCAGMQANGAQGGAGFTIAIGPNRFVTGSGGGGGGGHIQLETTAAACQPSAPGGLAVPAAASLNGGNGVVLVVVKPGQPLALSAGPNQNFATCAGCLVPVTFAPVLTNPDSDPFTFTWTEGSTVLASTFAPTVFFTAGTHTVQLTAVDLARNSTLTSTVVVTVTTTDLNALQQQLDTANQTIAANQSTIASEQTTIAGLTADKASLTSQLATANAQIQTLNGSLTAANNQIAALQAQLVSQAQMMTSLQAQLAAANASAAAQAQNIAALQGQLAAADAAVAAQAQTERSLELTVITHTPDQSTAAAVRTVVAAQIADAQRAGVEPKRVARAQQKLADGDAAAAAGDFKTAIRDYRDGYNIATRVVD